MTTDFNTLADSSEQRTAVIVPALVAILLGAFIIFGTGLVPAAAVHNAAHDSRHSFAFPCH